MTCKDCIHFEVCDSGRHIGEYIEDDGVYTEGVEKECLAFRSAPPLNPGDPVWFVLEEDGKWDVYEDIVAEAGNRWFFCPAVQGDLNDTGNRVGYDEIGTEVFLTKEAAEAALKERKP